MRNRPLRPSDASDARRCYRESRIEKERENKRKSYLKHRTEILAREADEKAARGAMRDVRAALERRLERDRVLADVDRIAALEARVLALETTVRELRAAAPAADLDSVLNVKETARAIGKAPSTLRHWLGDAQLFDRHQLAVLFRKDVSNRWTSSPRLVARWRQLALRQLKEACK